MSDVKQKMKRVIESFPEDASYDEIIRELVFERMVDRGMDDVCNDRLFSNKEMEQHINTWRK